jgi:outer membrane protein assembly factor BamB
MQKLKNRISAIAIAILLVISMAASMMLLPNSNAHTPVWNMATFAYIVVAPNPIGVGQTATIYMWLGNVPYPNSALENHYRYHGYTLKITAPDGTTTTQTWGEITDTTNSQEYHYTPTLVGTYNITFTYPSEKITLNDQPSGSAYVNDTFLPSSNSVKLTVQQDPIPAAVTSYPLPQNYWTRPINGENTDWWAISSNWLGTGSPVMSATGYGTMIGSSNNGLTQRYPGDAIGPQTAHIMWTKQLSNGNGGVTGGNVFPTQGVAYFDGTAYEPRFSNPIIVNGYLYYTEPLSFLGGTSGPTDCVDLQTGQLIWSRSDVPALSFAYIYDLYDPNQHGVCPAILFTSNFARAFDAATGNPLFNVTAVPSSSGTTVVSGPILGPSGEILKYVLANAGNTTNPDFRLGEWNSSKLWTYTGTAPALTNQSGAAITTPPSATATSVVDGSVSMPSNAQNRYDWNISIPWRNTISSSPTVVAAFYNNIMICENGSMPVVGADNPYTYFAVNLNPDKGAIGNVLWWNTVQPPAGNISVVAATADPTVGVFVESYRETMQWVGYSMTTGQKLWGPSASQTAFDYYGSPGVSQLGGQVAYGRLYSSSFGGILYCYDLLTGNLLWTYGNGGTGNSTNSGFATSYGDYPTFICAVGNGIIYLDTIEHTSTDPIYKGALARAINATDGTEIWTLPAYGSSWSQSTQTFAIADGFAAFWNGYDSQIYSIGRGPSATTVSAPDIAASFGTPIVIKGSVMDVSAGTQQTAQKGNFPNGVPVSSDANLNDWMSYIYQQRPFPTNFTGVPVKLDVVDSNGNYRNIGTAITTSAGTYSLTWTPDIPGDFQVIASFAGTNGYWPSSMQTAFTIMQAPTTTTAPTAAPASVVDTYFVPAVIAIIVVIIIGFAVLFLALRKRP